MAGVLICQQVKRNGVRCGSPAMRRKRYCFFYQREHEHGAKRTDEHSRQRWFERIDLNDANAVQRALSEVMQRIFEGNISYKKAAEILFKLREAVAKIQGIGGSNGSLVHSPEELEILHSA
jgi:hypothetical protein